MSAYSAGYAIVSVNNGTIVVCIYSIGLAFNVSKLALKWANIFGIDGIYCTYSGIFENKNVYNKYGIANEIIKHKKLYNTAIFLILIAWYMYITIPRNKHTGLHSKSTKKVNPDKMENSFEYFVPAWNKNIK